jgi:hypothetical protein
METKGRRWIFDENGNSLPVTSVFDNYTRTE